MKGLNVKIVPRSKQNFKTMAEEVSQLFPKLEYKYIFIFSANYKSKEILIHTIT